VSITASTAAATPGCEKETDESGFSAELAVPDKKNKVGLKRGRVWAGNCTKHKRGCN